MEKELLEGLFAEYYNAALFYALSLTKDKAAAEDLVADAFFKALTARIHEVESFKSWLLTVVRNGYLSTLRKNRHRAELSETVPDESEELLEKVVKDEEYRALYHAISLLPPNYTEVIMLFYFEDLTVREIAAVIQKSEGHVKTMLCRARLKLKELLG